MSRAAIMRSFSLFLETQGINTIPLARFVGNRFNILFYNAAGVYYLRDSILSFYDRVFGTPNRLHVAVRADVAVPGYVAACRALGIFDKVLTGPLWRVLANPSVHIADMSEVYTAICNKLDAWQDDPQDLLDGSARPFPGAIASVDEVSTSLFTADSSDEETSVILQLLSRSFAT
eukprot:scpid18084/ scgid24353/ 